MLTQPFPRQAFVFMCLQYKSFENTVGKGELARNEQVLLSPQCFPLFWRTFVQFPSKMKLFAASSLVWKSLKIVVC